MTFHLIPPPPFPFGFNFSFGLFAFCCVSQSSKINTGLCLCLIIFQTFARKLPFCLCLESVLQHAAQSGCTLGNRETCLCAPKHLHCHRNPAGSPIRAAHQVHPAQVGAASPRLRGQVKPRVLQLCSLTCDALSLRVAFP